MPRLTNTTYLQRHHQLRASWLQFGGAPFAGLIPNEQLHLWAYFVPTQGLSDPLLITHRTKISARFQSLPHSAGRAFARVQPFLEAPLRGGRKPRPAHRVAVQGSVRTEVDIQRLARAMTMMITNHIDETRNGGSTSMH